eukprot:TRINITY_DN536_c0_g1_i1.p1 TRINITY_DN536_c0_g1~~TRINITY_DN536_c0_g1_i1.p1  ORF type:complete len:706 (-),score=264.64 TRINITY_DN536_c0_g1_i1:618-2735(-)
MGDTPEIVVENHDANVTLTEKPDASNKPHSNDAIGANMDRDLLESLVNLEHELTGIDTRKTLAEGSRLCDEITMETNKLAKLIDSLKTEAKPSEEEIQQVVNEFTTKVNDLIKYHHDNKLTDKAEVDMLKTGVEKVTAAINSSASDPEQIEEAQRVLHIFIKNIDQVDGAYKAVRRRMSTTPTSAQVASPPRLSLSGHARQESSDSTTSSNQNTERSAGGQSVPTTPTAKTDGGMKHANTTPDFKKKKSYSVSSKKSKSKLGDNEIESPNGEENKEEDKEKKKRTHSRRTTLSLALPVKKEKEQKDEEKEKEKEKEKKDKKSKTPREEGDKKKKFSIKDSWKRLTSAFVPNSKEDKRHTMASPDTGDTIDWDAPVSPRKEKKEREKQEKEKEKELKKQEKEHEKQEKEKEKEREKQEQEKEKEPKSPRRLRLSLSMRKKSKSKREDSTMIKSSPASTARGDGSVTDRTENSSTSQFVTPRTARDASNSEEKAPSSNGKAATTSLKELPKTGAPDTPKLQVPDTPKLEVPDTPKLQVPDTPKLAIAATPAPTAQTPGQGNTPRGNNSPRAVLVREISKKMLVARRAPSQQQLRQIKTKLSQMRLAWDEYTTGGLTTQDISEIDEHALDADIKELENLEGFDVDDIVNFEPDGPALDDANMTDELKALDNILDEFDDEFDTPSMREPSSLSKLAGGGSGGSYLSAYD